MGRMGSRTAIDAFRETTRGLDRNGRTLKAIAKAETLLRWRVNRILKSYFEKEKEVCMSKPTEKERRFVARLEKLVADEDRGALAALRRGLGKPPGTTPQTYPIVEPWLPDGSEPWQDDLYYIVAALLAYWHQGSSGQRSENDQLGNLVALLRRLAMDENGKWNEDRFKSIERRFVALLNCHRDDLHVHLRHAVGRLRSSQKPIPVDWGNSWRISAVGTRNGRTVQRSWAKSFWVRLTAHRSARPTEAASAVEQQ